MSKSSHEPEDLYALPADAQREPPRTLAETMRQIGPGLILAASIVGTGELINTTGLGAEPKEMSGRRDGVSLTLRLLRSKF